jgi:hypothetical protein
VIASQKRMPSPTDASALPSAENATAKHIAQEALAARAAVVIGRGLVIGQVVVQRKLGIEVNLEAAR